MTQHKGQMLADGLGRHRPQVELQAAAQHGDWHFLRVSRSQHKFQILRRLFQRLQHGVESRVGQHVHLINHEDLEAPLHGFVDRLLQQGLNLVDAAVTGGIQLGIVHKASAINISARLADTTGASGDSTITVRALAVQRFSQDARHRGLANAARTGKQVGMVQALGGQRVGQGFHHVVLPHHLGKIAGAVLAGEHEIRHASILIGAAPRSFARSFWRMTGTALSWKFLHTMPN